MNQMARLSLLSREVTEHKRTCIVVCKTLRSGNLSQNPSISPSFSNFLFAAMASRYRSLSRPTINLLKSAFAKKPTPKATPSPRISLSSPSFTRSFSPMGSLQSLLPLYSAVSSARLTSCLGIDSCSSRSLSQELGLSVPR